MCSPFSYQTCYCIIVYDFSRLKRVLHKYEGRADIKRDGFAFKNSENKKEALLGIIKIN